MARWRLTQPHYLNVPTTEWEYVEVSRETGRQHRVRFPVHQFLNPMDPADCNRDGEIIVCHEGSATGRGDIVFVGEPTPDMEPLDEEAEAISTRLSPKWKHPIDSLPNQGDFSASLLTVLQRQLADIQNGQQPSTTTPNTSVGKAEFDELKAQMVELMKTNALLAEQIAAKAEPKPTDRRV